MKANRRDVIAPLYGGDYTRKKIIGKTKERQKRIKRKRENSNSSQSFFRNVAELTPHQFLC